MRIRLLIALAAALSLVLCEAQFARAGQKDPGNPCSGAPKYSVAKHQGGYASSGGSYTLYQYISVAEEVITKERLVQLACRLRSDFRKEKRMEIWIFTDRQVAERFSFSDKSPTHHQDLMAMRGEYYLDRDKGIEWVKFSTDRHKPNDRTTICLAGACE
jgi:hypothetical protein